MKIIKLFHRVVMVVISASFMMNVSAYARSVMTAHQTSWKTQSLSKAKSSAQTSSYYERFEALNDRWESVSDEWPDDPVTAMVFHNGNLYIGGLFKHIGNRSFSNIAMWDGHDWHSLDHGLGDSDYEVVDMVSYGGLLYVVYYDWWSGNDFFQTWDGTEWKDISGVTNGNVFTVYTANGLLYIGGDFSQAGGAAANNIAVGDGVNWSPLGVGVDGAVWEIAWGHHDAMGELLFAYHESPDPITSLPEPTHISVWNPTGFWHVFVDDLDYFLWIMKPYGERLYVGGELYEIGGDPFKGIAYTDGGAFHQMGNNSIWVGDVYALHHNGRSLFVGGWMLFLNNLGNISGGVARKWGDAWEPLGWGVFGEVWSDFVARGDYLYVGGYFDYAGGKEIWNLARYRMTMNYPYLTRGQTLSGGIHSSTSLGASFGDYDGDGDLDLFVANDWGKENYLFRNNGDGTFTKLKNNPVVKGARSSAAGYWADYDNDGDLDLFVINRNGENNQLFQNNGDGAFTEITEGPVVSDGASSTAGAWADYDNDGFLDLFVANKNGENNLLYHNNGDGTFIQITEGAIVNDGGNSRGCAWGDYNMDGFPDLFVANNQQENNFLYQNNGDGTFTQVTDMDVVNDAGGSWNGCWGDCDGDGDPDLFVVNDGELDFFYQNNGGTLVRSELGEATMEVTDSRSAAWGDCDKDGDLDLVVGVRNGESRLYINQGNGIFYLYMIPDQGDARGAVWGDYDGDGDLDLFVSNNGTTNNLYTHSDNDYHYVEIKLQGTSSNADGVGAKVYVTATIEGKSRTQMQEIASQAGTGLIAHFGLKDATSIEKVQVQWPSGIVWESDEVGIDQLVTITEPEEDVVLPVDQSQGEEVILSEVNRNGALPTSYQLYQNHPNPFNPVTTIKYDIPESGRVRIAIYDIKGQEVAVLFDGVRSAGYYEASWDGRDRTGNQMPSGLYVSQLISEKIVQTRKMVLMR